MWTYRNKSYMSNLKDGYSQLYSASFSGSFIMDADMCDIPLNGILDSILIFRNNPLTLENRELSRELLRIRGKFFHI